jgi:hypothetical protein
MREELNIVRDLRKVCEGRIYLKLEQTGTIYQNFLVQPVLYSE